MRQSFTSSYSRTRAWRHVLLTGCALYALAACAADVAQDRTGSAGSSASTPSTGTACDAVNRTGPCACDEAMPGRQVCGADLTWGLCECASEGASGSGDVAANRGQAQFLWLRTEPGAATGSCEPGTYGGALEGLYASPVLCEAAGFPGNCGLPVPIASIDVPGVLPGFFFELGSGGNGEILTVTGGKLAGNALAIFPFEADIADGQLDCQSGIFTARLINGRYTVPITEPPYIGNFEGLLVARYDAATRSFVDGVWSVGENGTVATPAQPGPTAPALPAGSGGTGTWTAMRTP